MVSDTRHLVLSARGMERVDSSSSSDMVEVDIDMEGEMNDFIGTPRGSRRLSSRGGARPAVGVMWLFLWNAVLPLAIAVLTTANAIIVNHNASTFLPWLDDGHNLGLLHAAMFVVVLGLWFAVTAFHRRARARGYLTFYRRTRGIKDAPLLAIGIGNGGWVLGHLWWCLRFLQGRYSSESCLFEPNHC